MFSDDHTFWFCVCPCCVGTGVAFDEYLTMAKCTACHGHGWTAAQWESELKSLEQLIKNAKDDEKDIRWLWGGERVRRKSMEEIFRQRMEI